MQLTHTDLCALCLQTRGLHDSHLVPKALYRLARATLSTGATGPSRSHPHTTPADLFPGLTTFALLRLRKALRSKRGGLGDEALLSWSRPFPAS